MNARNVLTQIAVSIASRLKPLGYRRRGLTFVRRGAEVISFIELQPSRASSPEELKFVVNYGVVVASLFEGHEPEKAIYTEWHYGRRVCGRDGVELWWTIHEGDRVDDGETRLWVALEVDVLPDLNQKQTEGALIDLWLTGRGPGLGEARRLFLLARLLHRAARLGEFAAVRSELETKARDAFGLRALAILKDLEC